MAGRGRGITGRAIEHAATGLRSVRAGQGVATQRIDETTRLQIVDAIVSAVHEAASSHYRLLRAFAGHTTLEEGDDAMSARGYRTHEFGDSVWFERQWADTRRGASQQPARSIVKARATCRSRLQADCRSI